MKKKTPLMVIVVLCLFFSGGCWNRRELNEVTFILGMALEIKDGQHFITMVSTDPSQKSGGQEAQNAGNSYIVLSSEGDTIFEAARNMTLLIPRRNTWSHCSVALISEDYAKEEGLRDLIDFFTRDPSRRNNIYIVVAKEPAALLKISPTLSNYLPRQMLEIIRQGESSGKSMDIPLYTFVGETRGVSGTSLTNRFAIYSQEGNPQTGGQGQEIRAVGSAVFRDFRLVGFLSPEETLGVNYARGEIKTSVETFFSGDGGKDDTNVLIKDIKRQVKTTLTKEGGRAELKLILKGTITEYWGEQDLLVKKTLQDMEKKCAQRVKQEILRAWNKSQELQADFFLLGDRFSHDYPELIQNRLWPEIFPQVELAVEVEVRLDVVGLRINPVKG